MMSQRALFIALALVSVGLFDIANAVATHCDRHKGNSEYRCGKDNYREDNIRITNRAGFGETVCFKIGKWISDCGGLATNYENIDAQLGPNKSRDFRFRAAASGKCDEFYVYNCRVDGVGRDCVDVLIVAPA